MKAGTMRMVLFGVLVTPSLLLSTDSAAGENTPGAPAAAVGARELVSPWRQTRTNEWVRYHYPMLRPPVYQDARLVRPQGVVQGWFETNNSPPAVEIKAAKPKPKTETAPAEPPNLDDPKALRQYALRNGLFMPEVTGPMVNCGGGG